MKDGMYQGYPGNSTLSTIPNVATCVFIQARHLALTGGDESIGLAISGKGPSYPIRLVVKCYSSSGKVELRQNMARHKTDYCAKRPQAAQAEEET